MKITILGKVPKGDATRETFLDWKAEYIQRITTLIPEAKVFHGDHIRDDVGSILVVGHDIWTVKNADVVIVDAQFKIGAGTAQEVMMAKFYSVPVVTVLPKDTHHRHSNVVFNGLLIEDWIHPFLDVSSDFIADSIEDAVMWVSEYSKGQHTMHIKSISVFEDAVTHFEEELPEMVINYNN